MEDGMIETMAANPPTSETTAPAVVTDANDDRNPVFEMLVSGDKDIIGLVAYSIYKQNKREWLMAFHKARGRDPNENEMAAYIIGDSTPRRLATFRHLAQATLEGRGPEVPFKPGQTDGAYPIAKRPAHPAPGRDPSVTSLRVSFITLGLVVVMAIYLAVRLGLPGR